MPDDEPQLVAVDLDSFADDYPEVAERMAVTFAGILGRMIARQYHEAEEQARRETQKPAGVESMAESGGGPGVRPRKG